MTQPFFEAVNQTNYLLISNLPFKVQQYSLGLMVSLKQEIKLNDFTDFLVFIARQQQSLQLKFKMKALLDN